MSESEIITWLQKVVTGGKPVLPRNDDQFIADTLKLSDWHGVTALIHHKLSEDNSLENYPAEFNKLLSAKYSQSIALSLLWKNEIKKVHASLQDANIKLLLIKGFPLAWSLYPAPYLRIFSDVDLLFPDFESAEKAWKILSNTGYTRPVTISGKYISHQFSCYRTGNSLVSCALDLHWRLNNHYFFANALKFDELELSSVPLSALEPQMRTLSPENALLFACMHRLGHAPFGESDRLIWLYDIHLLANGFNREQWSCFTALAKEKKLSSVCLDGLLNCKTRFNTEVPGEVLEMLQREGTSDPIRPVDLSSTWKYHLANFQSMPGWTERFCLLRELLFPPFEYMLAKYNRKNKFWLPILYVSRLAGGFMKILK